MIRREVTRLLGVSVYRALWRKTRYQVELPKQVFTCSPLPGSMGRVKTTLKRYDFLYSRLFFLLLAARNFLVAGQGFRGRSRTAGC
jgi:hypothetical protein